MISQFALTLYLTPALSTRKKQLLFAHYLASDEEERRHVWNLLDDQTDVVAAVQRRCSEREITIHPYASEFYPPAMMNCNAPPLVLFAQGNHRLLPSETNVSIVGTRTPTTYGMNAVKALVSKITPMLTTVSGLADGIDALVHRETLQHGGRTIAVCAFGFDHCYPAKNRPLLQQIVANNGVIVSEYLPHVAPAKWQFVARNRIIALLSKMTVVIEAKQRSGSLITAEMAMEEGKSVAALPGTIFMPFSSGTNELIADGATILCDAETILNEYK